MRTGAVSLLFALIPVVVLTAGAELALRMLHVAGAEERDDIWNGFAGSSPLFYRTRVAGQPAYRTSPNRRQHFNDQTFAARKEAGVFRIFTFGESTTFGEPWGDRGSFSHFLREGLQRAHPDARFDVINTGGKGYGSTAILEIVRDAADYEPDAFVFYLGHNEFREAAFHPAEREGSRVVPRLREFFWRHSRLYVVIQRGLRALLPVRGGARPTSFAQRQIAEILSRPFSIDSFRFPDRLAIPPVTPNAKPSPAVLDRFEANFGEMIAIARARRIPCFLLTVTRNEAFWRVPNRAALRPGAEQEYPKRYSAVLDAFSRREWEEVCARARDVEALYTGPEEGTPAQHRDAYLHVMEGDALAALGRPAEARTAYRAAWAEDPINDKIRRIAHTAGVPVIDSDRAARGAAPDSILDWSVFYDELHPDPALHRALGIAVIEALMNSGVIAQRHGAAPTAADLALPREPGADVFAYEALRALYVGDRDPAERAAEEALRLAPELGRAHIYAGICACARGDERRARQAWDALAQLYPQLLPAKNPGAVVAARQEGQ